MNEIRVDANLWEALRTFRDQLNRKAADSEDCVAMTQRYLRARAGEPTWAGQIIGLFRTPGSFSVKQGEQILKLCFAVDSSSGSVMCWFQPEAAEEEFWTATTEYLFSTELKYAPERLVCPEIETIVARQLPKMKPGHALGQVIPAFLLATAAGTKIEPDITDDRLRDFEAAFEAEFLR